MYLTIDELWDTFLVALEGEIDNNVSFTHGSNPPNC